MGLGSHKTAMLAAMFAGLAAHAPITWTASTPRQEPDNRGRRAEKSAERLAKAEEKRKRRAAKRLGHNDLGNRRAAFGATELTDGLCGNGSEVGAGDTAMKGKQ